MTISGFSSDAIRYENPQFHMKVLPTSTSYFPYKNILQTIKKQHLNRYSVTHAHTHANSNPAIKRTAARYEEKQTLQVYNEYGSP